MSRTYRQLLLRLNAGFLLIASTGGLIADIAGSFFASGPEALLLSGSPGAGIGFIEAHGLALIFGVLLWQAASSRLWHLTAAAVHVLLGCANLAFWQFFIAADVLVVGYVTTILHGLFAATQLMAALSARREGTQSRKMKWATAIGLGATIIATDMAGLPLVPSFVGKAEARIGQPWTAVSGAGMARRTTRRVIRRSAIYVATLPPACVRTSIEGVVVWRCGASYYQPYRGRYVVVYVH